MSDRPSRAEWLMLGFVAVCALAWLFMPVIPQPQAYHQFADQRSLSAIPNAADVLSNLSFAFAGLIGLGRLLAVGDAIQPVLRWNLLVLFFGLLITAFGSGYYHWNPSDTTLVADRFSMTFAFAGMLGALATQRVGTRAGGFVLILMLAIGPASVLHWHASGDLALYGIVQFGGMLGALLLITCTRRGEDPFPWWQLLACYVIAKLAEAGDQFIWTLTGGIVAGHALKHIVAGIGGIVIALALRPAALGQPAGPSREALR